MIRHPPRSTRIGPLLPSPPLVRSNHSDLPPGVEISYEQNDDGTFDGSVSLGNPNLEPYIADALDASAEWYFAKGGLFSVGVFAKFIKNPVYTQSFTLLDTSYGGRDYAVLGFSQKANGTSADLKIGRTS